jgi:hypothetical protein
VSTSRTLRTGLIAGVVTAGMLGTNLARAASVTPDWATKYPAAVLLANATSADGSEVFATGWIGTGATRTFLTIAYDGATGGQLWAKTYGGGQQDQGSSVAVSPDGSTVYVAGSHTVDEATLDLDWATVAYDASNGDVRWSRTYDAPAVDESEDRASAVLAAPNGLVYVTGQKVTGDGHRDFRTAAYEGSTGATRWSAVTRPGSGLGLALSPDGSTLVVRGNYAGNLIGTVTYNALTGVQGWWRAWDGPDNIQALSRDVVFTPDGKHILSAGIVATSDGGYDYALLRYGAADGVFYWARRYRGVPGYSEDFLTSIAMAPDGATVFVTGYGSKGTDTADYATVAYDPDSGVQKWVKRFNAGGTDQAESIAVDPTGAEVYVSGQSEGTVSGFDFVTLTYDASTGAKLDSWRYTPGSDVADLTLVNGSLVISGLGSSGGDPSGAGLTARFPT